MRLLSFVFACLLFAPVAQAQQLITRPTMTVADDAGATLALTGLDIDARIIGHLAETSMTLTFFNSTSRTLAGDLVFPLPPGSTVSGYALDVNGALVDGVVIDKQKARQVFDEEVRKGVDPGLVERVAGSAFRTRVFPIAAGGSRTVRVSYVSEVDTSGAQALYHLPLGFNEPVTGRLRVQVVRSSERPQVVGKGLKGFEFGAWQDSWVAETPFTRATLTEAIAVALPDVQRTPVAVERSADGHVYVAIHDTLKAPAASTIQPKRVTLFWDNSGSRAATDHKAELDLLAAWSKSLGKPVAVEVVTFNLVASAPVAFSLPSDLPALLTHLKGVTYDGATSFAALAAPAKLPDLYLLFSDGISNFGGNHPPPLRAPVFVFNGAAVANHDALRALAVSTGGAWIDLNQTAAASAVAAIGRSPFGFRGAKVSAGSLKDTFPQSAEAVTGTFSWVGRLDSDTAEVALSFGDGSAAAATRTYELRAAAAPSGEMLRRFWAQKKVAELALGGSDNEAAIAQVGKLHGIVTPGTSLLVLERLDQYIEHEVRPPASVPELVAAYDKTMAERAKQLKADNDEKLEAIVALWQERVQWWNTEFTFQKVSPASNKSSAFGGQADADGAAEGGAMEERGAMMDRMDMAPGAPAPSARAAAPEAKKEKGKADSDAPPPPPAITLKAWEPSTPYLSALKASTPTERYRTYLQHKAQWGTAPAFFLDCADLFYGAGDGATALLVLSNIAELELEEPALLRILGHRLLQLEAFELSIRTFEDVLKLRDDEPQSHRDLALARARYADALKQTPARQADARALYQLAVDGLARVVMQRWDRFAEIELIALVELNNIITKAKPLGGVNVPVDKRLVKNLDMDVRIVMTWDADMTDMDLHVNEPSGEQAYYGHNRTAIGGRVSRDFTQGYGPEEYSIRRAMPGTYEVKTKFYGSSAATLQGAVTLQVDVYTDYGRATEQRQSMTLRLTENKEMFTVGEIVFQAPRQRTPSQ